ncbi:MAG: MFS transporter [Candidatus Aminicenantia bacterium]
MDGFKLEKTAVLTLATLSSFLTPFMGSSINVALPSIGKEFKMNAILLAWVATIYLVSAVVFLVPMGRISDIYGRKRIFLLGIIVYTFASFLSAISSRSIEIIIFRALQGLGGSMILGTGVALLTSAFPPGERGRALGINSASVYLGLSLGPFIGGLLTYHFGWRSVFLVNIPLGFFIIILVLIKLKGEWAEARGESLDWKGSILYGISTVMIMAGFSTLPSKSGVIIIFSGILGLLIFSFIEFSVLHPVLNVRLFTNNRTFAFSNISALINYSSTSAVGFLLSLYLQIIKGFSPRIAGTILVSQPIIMAIFSPFAGRLSDRIEPRIVASSGMGISALGLFLLSLLNNSSSIYYTITVLIILGFGFALFSSPNTNAVMSSVGKKYYGTASGTLATMRLMGQMLSMGIATLIFSIHKLRTQITPEYFPNFLLTLRNSFIIFSILCFAGIFASLARDRIHDK